MHHVFIISCNADGARMESLVRLRQLSAFFFEGRGSELNDLIAREIEMIEKKRPIQSRPALQKRTFNLLIRLLYNTTAQHTQIVA
jgi:hypothetical protein